MTDIANQVKQYITGPAQAYHKVHYYQSFEVDPPIATAILGDYTQNALGWVTMPEGSTDTAVQMSLLSDDLYDTQTAQLAAETTYAQALTTQQQMFTNNPSQYVITTGLTGTMYRPTLATVESTQNFFSRPYVDPTQNKTIVSGQSDNFQSLSTAINTTNLGVNDQNSTLFVEWFGYIKVSPTTTTAGSYTFSIQSSTQAYLWVGPLALTDFTPKNATSTHTGKSHPTTLSPNTYVPIRIKYVCNGIQAPFSVTMSQNGQLISHGTNMFFTIHDTQGQPYEPAQIHYALTQTTPEAIAASLFNVYMTNTSLNNNYANNLALRKALSATNGQYATVTIASTNAAGSQAATLTLNNDGNLTLATNFASTRIQVTPTQNTYSTCTGGTAFQGTPTLTMNNVALNPYYTIQESTVADPSSGLNYMSYSFSQFNYTGNTKDAIYSVIHNLQETPSSNAVINAKSLLGNDQVTQTYTQPLGQPVVVTNLDRVATCQFTLQLTTGGNLIISNGKGQVWSLFASSAYTNIAQQVKAMAQNAVQNPDWMNTYTAAIQKGQDLQYLPVGQKLSTNSPLISSDGKFKLTMDTNNNLVLMTTTTMQTTRNYTTPTDPPHTYFLLGTQGKYNLGKHMLVDTSNQVLQPLTIGSNIFNYASSYQPTSKYAYPPSTKLRHHLTPTDNISKEECETLCNDNPRCSHYYSYTTNDGTNHCLVNNDDTSPRYLPTPINGTVQSSTLYVRDKVIDSSCNVNGYTPRYNTGITSDQFMSYNSYSMNPTPYNPTRDQEGACGDPILAKSLATFDGRTLSPSPTPFKTTESFTSRPTPNGRSNPNPNSVCDIYGLCVAEGFVPGYNPEACQTLNSKTCIADLSANLHAINQYSSNIRDQNTQINQMYHTLNTKMNDQYPQLANLVNNTPMYNVINDDGTITTDDRSLLGAMIADTKHRMMEENNMYIFANIAAATAVLGFLTFSP